MGFLDKVVDVLGFVEKEEVDLEEENAAEKPMQTAPKAAPVAVKPENKPATRINNVVSFNHPNRDYRNG